MIRKSGAALAVAAALTAAVSASSHREAPAITEIPKCDGTDFYMFRSYEPGHEDNVILIANFVPLQDPYGGPNYFAMDPEAIYEIHIDYNEDAIEDITFRFDFQTVDRGIAIPVGGSPPIAVPLVNIGGITAGDTSALNRLETFTLEVLEYENPTKRRVTPQRVLDLDTGADSFRKPMDYIGEKSFVDYEAYADSHIRGIVLPDFATPGRVFVGQRKDPFVVNLGETFDLVNIANPIGSPSAESDDLADKNVTSLCLEIPIDYLARNSSGIIGAWMTASLPRQRTLFKPSEIIAKGGTSFERGRMIQVSRLGNPLVNEVVIGLPDKDLFNASHPSEDGQFLHYVTNPTLPELVEILFGGAGVQAPNLFPRTDLVAAFLTGVAGLNQTATPAEMLRLNCSVAPTPAGSQNPMGVIGGDNAGFPNGRRPGDDVVDIALQVAMGRLISLGLFGTPADAPSGNLPFTDGAAISDAMFDNAFPFARTPIPGSRF